MDEEDLEKRARPRPRKEPRVGPPPLLKLVRRAVLQTTADYVTREEVAAKLRASVPDAGHCLRMLVKAGILEGPRLVPRDEEQMFHCVMVRWNGRFWEELGHPPRGIRESPREQPSKKELAEYRRKNPPVDSGWDGRGFYVVRGKAFRDAARAAGLPEDPTADWTCKCGVKNAYMDYVCRKCYEDRRREPVGDPQVPPKPLICKRCGSEVQMKRRRGRKLHPDHQLVTQVMEE